MKYLERKLILETDAVIIFQLSMKLQTNITVIYGLGIAFDGHLNTGKNGKHYFSETLAEHDCSVIQYQLKLHAL
jgi:cell division protein YceG involved in septum cleavage